MNQRLEYRPDIDGLRAIAVLAVLFYHAGYPLFSGGYVGVDVFFVISGYLITTILVREIDHGNFSLAGFYERRIRRIYPALYGVLLFVLIAAYFLYDPTNFTKAIKSVLATVGFVSNILFWTESGYFDAPPTLKPLLHTWSLAVEEQFYIILPWLLLLIHRKFPKAIRPILWALTLGSFGLSAYSISRDSAAAFYFPHLRAWELLVGSLLAVHELPKLNAPTKNIFSVAGLGMILWSVFSYSENTTFPGPSALLPVLGSALLIYGGGDGKTLFARLLSLPPIVFIGKISYSLYLWHWPIIIFGKYYLIQEPTNAQTWVLVGASIGMSIVSWRLVESPFRSRDYLTRKAIFMLGGAAMAITVVTSGILYFGQRTPGHFSEAEIRTFTVSIPTWDQQQTCPGLEQEQFKELSRCMLGDGASQPSFLLWGDSHAEALAPSLDTEARLYGASGYVANHAACPPLLGVYQKGKPFCEAINNNILGYIKEHPEWNTIVLAARWSVSTEGERFKTDPPADIVLVDSRSSLPAGSNSLIFEAGLDRTVKTLLEMDRKVVIVSTVPEVGYNVPSAYFIALRTGRDVNQIIAPSVDEYRSRNEVVDRVIDELETRYLIRVIDPSTVLCDDRICRVTLEGQPLYIDSNHLSHFGAVHISRLFQTVFEP